MYADVGLARPVRVGVQRPHRRRRRRRIADRCLHGQRRTDRQATPDVRRGAERSGTRNIDHVRRAEEVAQVSKELERVRVTVPVRRL